MRKCVEVVWRKPRMLGNCGILSKIFAICSQGTEMYRTCLVTKCGNVEFKLHKKHSLQTKTYDSQCNCITPAETNESLIIGS